MHWKFYTGEYDKIEYAILLKDGTTRNSCWPNAGTFHDLESGDVIQEDDVLMISPSGINTRG
jgi:hypothetical protein